MHIHICIIHHLSLSFLYIFNNFILYHIYRRFAWQLAFPWGRKHISLLSKIIKINTSFQNKYWASLLTAPFTRLGLYKDGGAQGSLSAAQTHFMCSIHLGLIPVGTCVNIKLILPSVLWIISPLFLIQESRVVCQN